MQEFVYFYTKKETSEEISSPQWGPRCNSQSCSGGSVEQGAERPSVEAEGAASA